ncbi:hypothetical protein [Erythrobacter donghaensis]|uniref:hypothetical protein n=1 Tax=Erythrobacter donghaensis TaxID=267135 RepID=UPI00117C70BC|nr:hypothetical protein [Erythrobacter donghaensis]
MAESVGLLFVHGIGEQARWAHLRQSVVELAELLRRYGGETASVSVVDRTDHWQRPPGQPRLDDPAPITVSLRYRNQPAQGIDFHCHEVWWADLGHRSGLIDSVRFWIWGLGQWGAPIYLDRDASGLDSLDKDSPSRPRPRRPAVAMPRSVGGQLGHQLLTRFGLAWAGLVAVLTVLSWSLFKKVAGTLGDVSTSPSLLVQYLGDVQAYEERARPGQGLPSDPGHPRRVAIRRRMVAEMVAMAARPHSRWYIMAHSLGSVVAFNGIGEIGHTLPNYLPRAVWEALPDALTTDPDCPLREDIESMMPARPGWLGKRDCINRPALFARLRGLVTYGSPLDKFAALWPRIVAFETQPRDAGPERQIFADCAWVNLVANTDPVAGAIDRFAEPEGTPPGTNLPRLHNVRRTGRQLFGLAHVQYWQVPRPWDNTRADYYKAVIAWLTAARAPEPADDPSPPFGTRYVPGVPDYLTMIGQALALTMLLWAAGAVVIAAVVIPFAPEEWRIFGEVASSEAGWRDYARFALRLMPAVAAGALLILYLTGHLRWIGETWADHRLAALAKDTPHAKRLMRLATAQIAAGATSLALGIILMIWSWPAAAPKLVETGTTYAVLLFGLIMLANLLQSVINRAFWHAKPE